jgi:DNA polymerase-3 subunit epsilon
MFNFPVVFVDIETTGGGYRTSRILEIAVIRYENNEIVDEFSSLIDPETRVPAFITGITGITDSDVYDAPKFRDIATRLSEIMEGAVFVAHNVNFDYSFIKSEFARLGVPFSMRKLCTVRLSRRLYSHEKGHSLEKLITRHNIPFENRHRATDDAKAILHFSQLALQEHGLDTFNEAVTLQLKTQSVPVNLTDTDIKSISNEPGVYIFKDIKGAVLYVGKSINMRTRVMSHFQDMAAKEVKIAQQTTKIESIPTKSEVLALLLESRLVKQLQPVYNRQLRRVNNYCLVVRSEYDGYAQLSYEYGLPGESAEVGSIYGLYENKLKAKKWMDIIARTYDLCPKLMGLENTKKGCFWYSLGRCRGACAGKETSDAYNKRFDIALKDRKLDSWPYEKEIEVTVDSFGSKLVIDNWIIKQVRSDIPLLRNTAKLSFDLDEYKIIKRYLKLKPI